MIITAVTEDCDNNIRFCLYSSQISIEVFLHLRYEGTDCALMITAAGHPSNAHSCVSGDFRTAFTKRYCYFHCEWSKWLFVSSSISQSFSFYIRYLKEFGFTITDRPIVVDDIRVRGSGKSGIRSKVQPKAGQKSPRPIKVFKLKQT